MVSHIGVSKRDRDDYLSIFVLLSAMILFETIKYFCEIRKL